MYKDKWVHTKLIGSEIYPEAYENPRAFFSISDPIFLESSIQCPWGG